MTHHFIHHIGTLAIAFLLFLGAEHVAEATHVTGRRRHAFLIALAIGIIVIGEYLHSPDLVWQMLDGQEVVFDIHAGLIAAATASCGPLVGATLTVIKVAAGFATGAATYPTLIAVLIFLVVATLVWGLRRWPHPQFHPLLPLLLAGIVAGMISATFMRPAESFRTFSDRVPVFATEFLGTLFLGGMILFHQARRRSDSLLKDALVDALDAFCRIDPDGRIREANKSAESLLGFSRDELLRMSIADLGLTADGNVSAFSPGKVATEARQRWEVQCRRKGGSVVDLEISTNPARGPDGGWNLFARDITARKAAEARSHADQTRLRLALDAAEMVVWELDIDTRAIRYSDNLSAISGREDLAPYQALDSFISQVHPSDRPHTAAAIEQTLSSGAPFECDYRVQVGPDLWRWLFGKGRCIQAADGRTRKVLGVAVDITRRREAEEHARRWQQVFENAESGFADINIANDTFIEVNRAFAEQRGYTPAELAGRPIREIVAPEHHHRNATAGPEESTHEHRVFESLHLRRDGSRFPVMVELTTIRDPQGRPSSRIACVIDLTEHHRVHSVLEEERRRLTAIVEGSRVGTWEWDIASGACIINERWAEIVGYTVAELAPITLETWNRLAHPEDLAASHAIVERHFAGELPYYECEVRMRHKDGRWIWILDRGRVATWDSAGKPRLMMGTHTDITQLKQAEADLHEGLLFRREAEKIGRIGAWKVSPQTDFLYWTEGIYEIVEAPPDFRPGLKEGLTLYDADAIPVLQEALAKALADGTGFVLEIGLTTLKGRHIWTEVRGLGRIQEGGESFVMGTFQDITERKKAEARLRLLRDLGLTVARTADRDDALRRCLKAAIEIAGVEAGGVYVVEPATGDLDLVCHDGLSTPFIQAVRHYAADAPNTRWAAEGRIFHGSVDDLPLPSDAVERREGLRALSLIPVLEGGRLVALINIASHQSDEIPQAARTALESVGGVVVGVLQRANYERHLREANADLERRVSERTQELASSELRYRSLFESSRDAILIVSADGPTLDCNPAAIALFGFKTKTELLSRSIPELSAELQPDGRPSEEAYPERNAVIMEKGSHFFEWTHRRADGTEFPCEVAVSVARIDGKPLIQGMIRDISSRRAAEIELRRSETRFRRFLEMAPIPMGLANDQGELTFLNARFVQTFGYNLQDLPNLDAWRNKAYPDPAYREQVWIEWQSAIAEAAHRQTDIQPNEYRVTCRDGTVRDVIIGGIKLGADVLATFLDVTGLRKADADLRKLRSAVEQSPTVVVITDIRGDIEYVNPAFETQTGYRSAEVIGGKTSLLKSGFHDREFYRDLWQTLRAKHIWRGDFCNRRKDGSLFWESATIAPVLDSEGRLTHFVAIKEDITQRRQAAEDLRRAKEAAETANQAKSRFLANMSHEIRTPMNVILGFSQILRRDPELPPRHRQHLDTINRSGEHLLRLINDILDMSKIEAGRMRAVPVDFDFDALLDDLATMFRLRAEDKGLQFELVRDPGVPVRLHTDPGRVRQVLLNLLGNAVKFTATGSIQLRVTTQPHGIGPSVHILVEVADTGPGISPRDLKQIFEPFEQASAGPTQGGTGLGLAISRQLARVLGGEVTATSEPGVGSVFRFTFAALRRDQNSLSHAIPWSPGRSFKLKPGSPTPSVLVVDDSISNRELLSTMLESSGFVVYEATHGMEAVAFCAAASPSLVLMDRRMPGIDGLEATSQIRRGPHGSKVRILIVSASVLDGSNDWQESGADGFVAKPFSYPEFMARLGSLLAVEFDLPPGDPGTRSLPSDAANTQELPQTLRDEIVAATESGDVARLRCLIEESVMPSAPGLGQNLRQWVTNFDYLAILEYFRQEKS
ncbi:MAG: PAS domain S-box protein [Verrucomicrobiales bacterium]|nr:PAS domain S-box protein [Verrucomicrobiales bacterium]